MKRFRSPSKPRLAVNGETLRILSTTALEQVVGAVDDTKELACFAAPSEVPPLALTDDGRS